MEYLWVKWVVVRSPWSFALNRTPLPKDSSGEMELKAEQTAREIEEVSCSN